MAQIVGKAGKAQGEQDARLFFQVREGETQEERDTRVQEQTAKLLNKNPLLASSSTPQFHKTLAILQGGRASDLISAAVEARQSELLDLKTDAGILNSNIPTVNDIVNEETDKLRASHPGVFSDVLSSNVVDEGLRRFQTEFGAQIAQQQNAIKEELGVEALTDEVTLATFKIGAVDQILSGDFKVIDSIITKLGREGVAPRDAREAGLAGFIEGVRRISRSKADGYGPDVAASLIVAASRKRGGLSIGGRTVFNSAEELSLLADVGDEILRQQEIDEDRENRKVRTREVKRRAFAGDVRAAALGPVRDVLTDLGSNSDALEAGLATLSEETLADPEKSAQAEQEIRDLVILESEKGRAFDHDQTFENDTYSLVNSGDPNKIEVARNNLITNPEKFSSSALKDLGARVAERGVVARAVLEHPQHKLLLDAARDLGEAFSGRSVILQAEFAQSRSEEEDRIRAGAFDLVRTGRSEELSEYFEKAIPEFRRNVLAAQSERVAQNEEFRVSAGESIRRLNLSREDLKDRRADGTITIREHEEFSDLLSRSEKDHGAAITAISNEITGRINDLARGGFESELVQANPSLQAVADDPSLYAKLLLDSEKEVASGVEAEYKKLLLSSPTDQLSTIRSDVLQSSIDKFITNGILQVGGAPKDPESSTEEAKSSRREGLKLEADTSLAAQTLDKSPSDSIDQIRLSTVPNRKDLDSFNSIIDNYVRGPQGSFSIHGFRDAPEITEVSAQAGEVLSSAKEEDRKGLALSIIAQSGLSKELALDGKSFSYFTVNQEALRESRERELGFTLEELENTEVGFRTPFQTVRLDSDARLSGNDDLLTNGRLTAGRKKELRELLTDPWGTQSRSDLRFGGWIHGTRPAKFKHKEIRQAGLVPSNAEFQIRSELDLSGEVLPYRTAAIDFRISQDEAFQKGISPEKFFNGDDIKETLDGETYDLTDPLQAFEHFKLSNKEGWRSILTNAKVDTSDPEAIADFNAIVTTNIAKFLRKGVL